MEMERDGDGAREGEKEREGSRAHISVFKSQSTSFQLDDFGR